MRQSSRRRRWLHRIFHAVIIAQLTEGFVTRHALAPGNGRKHPEPSRSRGLQSQRGGEFFGQDLGFFREIAGTFPIATSACLYAHRK